VTFSLTSCGCDFADPRGGVWNVASSSSRDGNRASADTSPACAEELGFGPVVIGLGFQGDELYEGLDECEGRGDGDGRGARELAGLEE
jgi:hypothetical protein